MTKDTTKAAAVAADIMLFDNWFDSIEGGVRERVRASSKRCWKRNWTAPCAGHATGDTRRTGMKRPPHSLWGAGTGIASAR